MGVRQSEQAQGQAVPAGGDILLDVAALLEGVDGAVRAVFKHGFLARDFNDNVQSPT